ncbi:NAD(P)H-dependent oxidoreductase [Ralstonia pseudosolanacearum]
MDQMKKAFIINAHLKYPFSAGRLNTSLIERAAAHFKAKGYEVMTTIAEDGYDVAAELEKFKSANVFLLQMPLNWMGTSQAASTFMLACMVFVMPMRCASTGMRWWVWLKVTSIFKGRTARAVSVSAVRTRWRRTFPSTSPRGQAIGSMSGVTGLPRGSTCRSVSLSVSTGQRPMKSLSPMHWMTRCVGWLGTAQTSKG